MHLHDSTLVEAGTWHDFHSAWIIHLKEALNAGLLPQGYYAQAERHSLNYIADVLTLHVPSPESHSPRSLGGVSALEAPPKVSTHLTAQPSYKALRKTVVVRRVSGHRIVGLIEILSPGNKDGKESARQFVAKAADALKNGLNLLLIDLFPPGKHDPRGMHGAIWKCWFEASYKLPKDRPFTLCSYESSRGAPVEAYLEHLALGEALVDMPLFLREGHYINVPLEATYEQAFRGVPEFFRERLSTAKATKRPRKRNS